MTTHPPVTMVRNPPPSATEQETRQIALKRLLRFRAQRVLCTDPYVVTDDDLWPLDDVLAESDLLVIATPHEAYAGIQRDIPIIDIWNLLDRGERV